MRKAKELIGLSFVFTLLVVLLLPIAPGVDTSSTLAASLPATALLSSGDGDDLDLLQGEEMEDPGCPRDCDGVGSPTPAHYVRMLGEDFSESYSWDDEHSHKGDNWISYVAGEYTFTQRPIGAVQEGGDWIEYDIPETYLFVVNAAVFAQGNSEVQVWVDGVYVDTINLFESVKEPVIKSFVFDFDEPVDSVRLVDGLVGEGGERDIRIESIAICTASTVLERFEGEQNAK